LSTGPCKKRPDRSRRGLLLLGGLLLGFAPLHAQQREADAAWSQGRYDEARAAYARELVSNPRSARANLRIGVFLSWQGKLDSALIFLARARASEPADQDIEWSEAGLEGMSRFVRRLWRTVLEVAEAPPADGEPTGPLAQKAHETIARVTDDIDRRFQFNTPIAAVMELVNEINRAPGDPAARFAGETAVSLIQPYAPHVAAELWERLGHERRVWEEPWAQADPAQLERETFELVVQVNGRVRDKFDVSADLSDDELVARATASPKVQAQLNGKEIRKTIVVPRKLVNIVVRE